VRTRQSYYEEIEERLLTWFYNVRNQHIEITYLLVQEQALFIAAELASNSEEPMKSKYQAFQASIGYITRFCDRHNIASKVLIGEAGSVDMEVAQTCRDEIQNIVTSGNYQPKDIFNLDETGLYFRLTPILLKLGIQSPQLQSRIVGRRQI